MNFKIKKIWYLLFFALILALLFDEVPSLVSFQKFKGSNHKNDALKDFVLFSNTPDNWQDIPDVNLPKHTRLLRRKDKNQKSKMYITFKNIDKLDSRQQLSPEEYIYLEGSHVDKLKITTKVIGNKTVYQVVRPAAGEETLVLMNYLFHDDKVLRVSVYPYEGDLNDQRDAESVFENINLSHLQ